MPSSVAISVLHLRKGTKKGYKYFFWDTNTSTLRRQELASAPIYVELRTVVNHIDHHFCWKGAVVGCMHRGSKTLLSVIGRKAVAFFILFNPFLHWWSFGGHFAFAAARRAVDVRFRQFKVHDTSEYFPWTYSPSFRFKYQNLESLWHQNDSHRPVCCNCTEICRYGHI